MAAKTSSKSKNKLHNKKFPASSSSSNRRRVIITSLAVVVVPEDTDGGGDDKAMDACARAARFMEAAKREALELALGLRSESC